MYVRCCTSLAVKNNEKKLKLRDLRTEYLRPNLSHDGAVHLKRINNRGRVQENAELNLLVRNSC